MQKEIIIHAADYPVEKESINIIIAKNLTGKLDAYLKRYDAPGSVLRVELTVRKEKDGTASGKLSIINGGLSLRSSRENFENLHDLVNHLFSHIKDQLVD